MSFNIKPEKLTASQTEDIEQIVEDLIPEPTVVPAATPSVRGTLHGFSNNSLNFFGQPADTNTAIGGDALMVNDGVINGNTAVGHYSLKSNNIGTSNTSVGSGSLMLNTSGYGNTSVGAYSLRANINGFSNCAVGSFSMSDNTSGNNNVAVGATALYSNTTGADNVAIGSSALYSNTTGSHNIVIGSNVNASSPTVQGEITLGNSNIQTLRCQVTSITSLSDSRDKTDIEDINFGLDLVNELRPVQFAWNMRDGGKVGVKDIGFIAQELAEAEDALDAHDVLALTYRENPEKLEASYGRLVPILVKAIQELSERVKELEANK